MKVNDLCIGCGTCAAVAPELFEISEETKKAVVIKQPETPEENQAYETAKSACPVGAIE